MKRTILILLAVSIPTFLGALAVFTVLGSGTESIPLDTDILTSSVQAQTGRDVVILGCTTRSVTGGVSVITNFSSSSPGAPSIPDGENCAEVLASLADGSFEIVAGGSGLIYTLGR